MVFVDVADEDKTNTNENIIKTIENENSCSYIGCLSTKNSVDNSSEFYRLPTISTNMPSSYQHIEKKRRQAWLETIKCNTMPSNEIQICSKHFHYGKLLLFYLF